MAGEEDSKSAFAGESDSMNVDPDFVDKPDIAKEDAPDPEDDEPENNNGYAQIEFYDNLAAELPSDIHNKLVRKYLDLFEEDKRAREKRDERYAEGIRRTGVSGDAPGGADFSGASKAVHPGLAKACVDFCAKSMKEIFPPAGPVKIQIEGKLTKEKIDRAERKRRHMNYQFTKEIKEYRSVLEQTLTQLPLGGSQFIKFYPDFLRKRPSCEFVRIDNVFFPYSCADFYSAQRVFHNDELSEFEYQRRIDSGYYTDPGVIIDVSNMEQDTRVQIQMDKVEGKEEPSTNIDGIRPIADVFMWDNIEIDDKADPEREDAPYVMTIDIVKKKIIALYRNWEEEDKTQEKMDWMVKFGFIPWDGPLEVGLPHLIGSLSASATGSLRALLDSALTQTIPTGIMLKGTTISGQTKQIGPTKITELQSRAVADDITKIFMHLPYNPPSAVMLSLLQFLDGQIEGMVKTSAETSDTNANVPVGTKLADIEQAMTVYSSIHARLHDAQRRCLEIVHRMNRFYMDDEAYDLDLGFAVKADYKGQIDVQPVSDPNIYTESQRFGQLQAAAQLVQMFPDVKFDKHALCKWALSMMRIANVDELLPDPQKPRDENPAAENIMMAMGRPAIALPDQDHISHLKTLLDFMENPMLGQNPLFMSTYMPLAINHAKQTLLYLYGDIMRTQVEHALGTSIEAVQDEDPEISKKFSELIATASPLVINKIGPIITAAMKILAPGMQYVQQQQQAQQAQNPVLLELQAKNKEADAKTGENQIEQMKVTGEQQLGQQKIQVDQEKNEVSLEKNREDNDTALQIASMKVVTGGGTGGLKDGTSLGNNEG